MKSKKSLSGNKTVMLIDDNDIDNFINEKMIKSSHFAENVYVHTSAKSALEFLKNISILNNAPTELSPSYIFLDINMPILDGFHFLEEFENFPAAFKAPIKIVMLTTSLNPIDLEKSKPYKNVVKYLYKPLISKDLDDLAG
ncbi:MAG: response regulator [Bacteroidia bacterium]